MKHYQSIYVPEMWKMFRFIAINKHHKKQVHLTKIMKIDIEKVNVLRIYKELATKGQGSSKACSF